MALTGRPDGRPLVAPDGLVRRAQALGAGLGVDVLALLGERAAIAGFYRAGAASCAGAARLLATADGWVAVNLPRQDDRDSIPAWLGVTPGPDLWSSVAPAVSRRTTASLVEGAGALGLAVAGAGDSAESVQPPPVVDRPIGNSSLRGEQPLVVDLSSLWAGPLCARLLHERGARVVKVESRSRPDGSRRGPPAFFRLMHAGARLVGLDLATDAGRAALHALVARADVVIEASRPRALRQLGLHAEELLAGQGPGVWVSITGYGRSSDRVAFGDDAAAAGGLLAWDDHGPCFVADAVADPLTGVVAAAAATDALRSRDRRLLDVSMTAVAAHVAGGDAGRRWCAGEDAAPGPPRLAETVPAPPAPVFTASEPPPAVGADNDAVAAELGITIP
jgi:hypothetical protein